MTAGFDTAAVPSILFRVGHKPEVWEWTDWRFVGADGTFGGRWDDPEGHYRVLYASESRSGALVEALAAFRPDLHILAAYEEIEENDPEAPPTAEPGAVPQGWRGQRLIGRGVSDGVDGPLVVVGGSATLATLRNALAGMALALGITDLDAAAIRLGAPRAFTQLVSRYMYEQVQEDGSQCAGVMYLSRHGDDIIDVGLFEREGSFPGQGYVSDAAAR